jgi:hypothetical protein
VLDVKLKALLKSGAFFDRCVFSGYGRLSNGEGYVLHDTNNAVENKKPLFCARTAEPSHCIVNNVVVQSIPRFQSK